MQVEGPERIRNLALTGHSDTGKTTLASGLLHTSGVNNRLNRVEDGNTTTDFDPEETEREISIGIAPCFAPWQKHKVNLLDCPGYGIFFSETMAGIRAADSVLLCIGGVAGVEVTTEKIWEYAEEAELPVMLHLTKMDRERASLDGVLEAMQSSFGREVVPIQLPIGAEDNFSGVVDLISQTAYSFEKDGNGKGASGDVPEEMKDAVETARNELIEAVAETNDDLLTKFFDEGTLTDEDLVSGLKAAIAMRKLFPVTMSSAVHGIGNSALLDAAISLLPSPIERAPFGGQNVGGEPLEIDQDSEASAIVFKTLNDPFSGKISLIRVVSGTLAGDAVPWNSREEKDERLGGVAAMQGKTPNQIEKLVTGDIGGVAKLKFAHTGDTLCDKQRPLFVDWFETPEAAISFAIEPKSKGDDEKIGEALHRLMEEDPTLHAGRDEETGEYLISGAGQLHVEIAVARLKKRFNVEVILHPPKVPYRETIQRPADGHGRHKKQSGGRGQFADCRIKIEPLPRGGDFEFADEIFGGSIPQTYRPAVEKGIQEARKRGFLAGYPVVDFKVRLLDGQYHDVDSSEMAFKIAGSLGFKDAMDRAGAVLLEPIMKVDVTTEEDYTGDIMSDLSQRRGRPQGMETKGHSQIITAEVPMAEMLNYAPSLNSMTQGRSSFHMEFLRYDPVPRPVQEKIIAESKRDAAEG